MQSALSGVDIALWDLKARKLNVPIYQLLGGRVRDKVRVYSWIGGDNPKDVEAQAYVLSCFRYFGSYQRVLVDEYVRSKVLQPSK